MKAKSSLLSMLSVLILMSTVFSTPPINKYKQQKQKVPPALKRYLYVATPGIRDYLGYGGHGILVFDINNNHKFVKRIKTNGLHPDGTPSNVKGIAVSVPLNSIFVSTLEGLQRIDLATEKIVWEKKYEGGCDRMSISPDGQTMYLPSLEKDFWNVVECSTGNIIKKIQVVARAHNTIYGPSGNAVYMADIASHLLFVADPKHIQSFTSGDLLEIIFDLLQLIVQKRRFSLPLIACLVLRSVILRQARCLTGQK